MTLLQKTELVDIPMVGRKFTWYKLTASVKSRIDRVLVSRERLEVWPDSKQFVILIDQFLIIVL